MGRSGVASGTEQPCLGWRVEVRAGDREERRGAQTCSDPRRLVRRQGASSSAHHPSVCPDLCFLWLAAVRPPRKGSSQLLATEAPLWQSRVLTRGSQAGTCCQVPVRTAGSPLPLLPCFPTTCFAKSLLQVFLVGAPCSPSLARGTVGGLVWSFSHNSERYLVFCCPRL